MSPYDYPEDEFDVAEDGAPTPVGVHRAQVPVWRSWLPLLLVLVLAPLLAWGAVSLLGRVSSSGTEDGAQAAATTAGDQAAGGATGQAPADPAAPESGAEPTEVATTPAAQADLTTGVTVLNGTSTTGLASRTGDRLTNAGFTTVSIPSGVYSETDPDLTTVYYASPEDLGTAQAAASTLGITNVVESAAAAQSNPIVVILRSDYTE